MQTSMFWDLAVQGLPERPYVSEWMGTCPLVSKSDRDTIGSGRLVEVKVLVLRRGNLSADHNDSSIDVCPPLSRANGQVRSNSIPMPIKVERSEP